MKAHEFDTAFDAGANVTPAVNWSKARRPNEALRRVMVDLPEWMVEALDRQARRMGVSRDELVRIWIAARLG
jgi:hypothetical protein